ncbi:MAG: DUF4339 domain-containing protein [Thermoguttaceae bacterium]|nr:DUF4339 domain-containing protein [Thermoguttaceae bacterium]
MGIRFFCPNGHPLNVRTELAGRKGYCPTCKVKMRIPKESMRDKNEREYHGQPTAELITDDAQETPSSKARLSAPSERGQSGKVSDGVESLIRQAVDVSASTARRNGARGGDLTTELDNPDALWFVLVSDSQQYGPAGSRQMRDWILERRVGPKTLVRRSDWSEAREAKDVFPSDMFSADDPRVASPAVELNGANQAFLDDPRLLESDGAKLGELHRRRRKTMNAFYTICSLIGVIAVLMVALIVVLLTK